MALLMALCALLWLIFTPGSLQCWHCEERKTAQCGASVTTHADGNVVRHPFVEHAHEPAAQRQEVRDTLHQIRTVATVAADTKPEPLDSSRSTTHLSVSGEN